MDDTVAGKKMKQAGEQWKEEKRGKRGEGMRNNGPMNLLEQRWAGVRVRVVGEAGPPGTRGPLSLPVLLVLLPQGVEARLAEGAAELERWVGNWRADWGTRAWGRGEHWGWGMHGWAQGEHMQHHHIEHYTHNDTCNIEYTQHTLRRWRGGVFTFLSLVPQASGLIISEFRPASPWTRVRLIKPHGLQDLRVHTRISRVPLITLIYWRVPSDGTQDRSDNIRHKHFLQRLML